MKKKIIYIFLVLLIGYISTTTYAGNQPLKGNNFIETRLGKIKLFDQEKQIVSNLGSPVKKSYDKITSSNDMYYEGLRIHLDQKGYVIDVEATSASYLTYRGIKVGDKKSMIIQNYGKPSIESYEEGEQYMQYNSTEYQGWVYSLRFYIQKNKITKITVFDPWGNGL